MQKLNKKIFIFILALFLGTVFLLPIPTNAQQTIDEIQQILEKPQPRIQIPGTEFTDIKDLEIEEGAGGETYLHIPFLSEYIGTIYRYLVVVVSIMAVIGIFFAGMLWMFPIGDREENIKKAKSQISGAVIGLSIALLSYVLLYTINPDLVRFRSLRILFVEQKEFVLPENDLVDYANYSPENIAKPTWTAEGEKAFDCEPEKRAAYPKLGVIPEAYVRTQTCPRGVIGTFKVTPDMGRAICKAGEILHNKGYAMQIVGSHRSFESQVSLWCGKGKDEYPDPKERKRVYAVPGYSSHGHGRAVDAVLIKDGERAWPKVNGKTQCDKVLPSDATILANAFYQADEKFGRLSTELWHFEYGTNRPSITKETGLPSKSCS